MLLGFALLFARRFRFDAAPPDRIRERQEGEGQGEDQEERLCRRADLRLVENRGGKRPSPPGWSRP